MGFGSSKPKVVQQPPPPGPPPPAPTTSAQLQPPTTHELASNIEKPPPVVSLPPPPLPPPETLTATPNLTDTNASSVDEPHGILHETLEQTTTTTSSLMPQSKKEERLKATQEQLLRSIADAQDAIQRFLAVQSVQFVKSEIQAIQTQIELYKKENSHLQGMLSQHTQVYVDSLSETLKNRDREYHSLQQRNKELNIAIRMQDSKVVGAPQAPTTVLLGDVNSKEKFDQTMETEIRVAKAQYDKAEESLQRATKSLETVNVQLSKVQPLYESKKNANKN
eukprot:PhF_6_TR29061/c0_g1_i1/m.42344